ncbi:MAG: ATP-binding protein [Thermodesulfobacteriota bacterium]|nr:ATP-binding protein [Thermodesulfobacteriota bacterium]
MRNQKSEIRIQKSKIPNQLACTFSSSLELVDQAVQEAVMFLKEHNSRIKIFDFTLILREALNNAVLHGNKGNIDRQVKFNLVVTGKTMEISVIDQGQGFNWRTACDKKIVGSQATHGRGLSLMKSYGYSISFNDAGNQMTLKKW